MIAALEARVKAPMASFAVEAFAPSVNVPVLVVHDTDDREVPYANGERLAERLRRALADDQRPRPPPHPLRAGSAAPRWWSSSKQGVV